MNAAPAESPLVGQAEPIPAKAGEGWSRTRWLTVIALIFAAHVGLIFIFGERGQIVPRAATNVPALQLASDADELIALNDPTLFALPHQRDFASAVWLKMPDIKPPSFRYTETLQPLPLPPVRSLGATFGQFMQTNLFASRALDFKPSPRLSTPTLTLEPLLAQNSTLRVEGELAERLLPAPISLTNWPYADVIAPSRVQVTVDEAGNVFSCVLLPSDNALEAASQYADADQRALELARALRFKPSLHRTVGWVIFNWHTVPPPPTSP
jgi:hypothetical protein